MKSPYPWFGGKSTIMPEVWKRLGDTPNSVDPFLGSNAPLLSRAGWDWDAGQWRDGKNRIETVNDADEVRDWAIANGDNPKLRIALFGYEEEHAATMPASWECLAWKARSGFGLVRAVCGWPSAPNRWRFQFDNVIPLWYYTPMETQTERITHNLNQTAFSLRLPPMLHQRLKMLARLKRRSMNQTIIIAVEMLLRLEDAE